MNLADYQALAMRTSQWRHDTLGHRGERHRAYGAISLAGESGEVIDLLKKHDFNGHAINRAKLMEEAGDTMWSLACIADGSNVALCQDPLPCTGLALAYPSLRFASLCARIINDIAYRGWASRIDIAACVGGLVACIEPHGITLEECMIANVAKLRARYPDGYSDAASQARADEGPPTSNHRVVATIERGSVITYPEPIAADDDSAC